MDTIESGLREAWKEQHEVEAMARALRALALR